MQKYLSIIFSFVFLTTFTASSRYLSDYMNENKKIKINPIALSFVKSTLEGKKYVPSENMNCLDCAFEKDKPDFSRQDMYNAYHSIRPMPLTNGPLNN